MFYDAKQEILARELSRFVAVKPTAWNECLEKLERAIGEMQ